MSERIFRFLKKDGSGGQVHIDYTEAEVFELIKANFNWFIFNIENPSEEMCLAAIDCRNFLGGDIFFKEIKHPQTESICLAIVKREGFSLKFITNQTFDICKAAVSNYPLAIEYVKDQTVDLCLAALECDTLFPHQWQSSDNKEVVRYTRFNAYKFVKIVDNPDHETTLKNLLAKKQIIANLE